METKTSLWPASAGLVLVAMMAIAFALDLAIMMSTNGDPVIASDSLGADLLRVKSSAIWPVETWIYTLMSVPAALFLVGLYRTFRAGPARDLATMGTVMLAVFWAVHTLHNVAILSVVNDLAPYYVPGAQGAASIEASARGLIGVGHSLDPFRGLALPFLVAGALCLARAARASRQVARWTGTIAYAISALASVGFLQIWFRPLLFASLLGWILFMTWTAAISVQAVRVRARGGVEQVGPADALLARG